ncbi:MAG: DUF262 domain-containing protein [Candidatus Methanoperedens sp.]
MSLQDEIDKTAKVIYSDSYQMSIGELISLYKDNELDIHPEFQRVFRWTESQKSKLIESILLGIPLPSIFVSQRKEGVWDVIDGVQRLSTIFEFVGIFKDENGFAYPPSKMISTKYLPSLDGKMWESNEEENSLTPAQRINLKRSKITIQIVNKESDPNIKYELFQRLNSLGTSLSDQEKRNCLLIMLNKRFYNLLDELSKNNSFLNCISLSEKAFDEKYQMELALRFIIFKNVNMNEMKEMKGFVFLEEYITDKMTSFAESKTFDYEREIKIFKQTFDFLDKTLGEDSFKRFDGNKFSGRFLLSAFEAVGIGVGTNIEEWTKKTIDDNLIKDIYSRASSLWSNSTYINNIGSGSNFNTRIPAIVPLGKEIFKP